MCGIAGIYSPQKSVSQPALESARQRLLHRGPDGYGEFVDGDVGLVHTRLSIIDLAGGAQPLVSCDGRYQLVANGEIYNYPELRQSASPEWQTRSESDCEAIIQQWHRYGPDGLKQLHGMFAFALFDTHTRELVLARDRTGIKPLYLAKSAAGLSFASEVKALLPLLEHQPDICGNALAEFLDFQFSSGGKTIFDGIEEVRPGELVRVSADGNISRQQWWSLARLEPVQMDMTQAQQAFQPLFDQVMLEHMRSDVPFGLFLSGGIDSSVLLAELSELRGEGLRTWSIGFEGSEMADELDAATALARHFKSNHQAIRVGKQQLFDAIVRSTWAADDLMRDYANLPTLLLSELAGKEVKVVFSGEGGDEAFAGYRRYRPSLGSLLKSGLLGAGGHRSRPQWVGPKRRLMRPQLAGVTSRRVFIDTWEAANPNWDWMQKSQAVDIQTALADNLLQKADRMMMSGGLEGRVPFSDHRLIEFGLSLPREVKYGSQGGKLLLRQWSVRHLPSEVLSRPKRGFYVPVAEWLQGDFLQQLEQRLMNSRPVKEWFEPDAVEKLFGWHRRGKNCSREIWSLMQFAIWYQLMIEAPDSVPDFRENPLDWIA